MTRFIQISIFFSIILFAISSNATKQWVKDVATNKNCAINIDINASIKDLKKALADVWGIPIEDQIIVAAGSVQQDTRIIADIKEDYRSPLMLLKQTPKDNLSEVRANFNESVNNGDYDMARVIAYSVLNDNSFTTEQHDEVHSWFGKLLQDNLSEARANFNESVNNGDYDIARSIAYSVLNDNSFTTEQHDEVHSWFGKLLRSVNTYIKKL